MVNDRDGVLHRGTLQLPRRAPAAPGRPPSSADLARLRPLMSTLGDSRRVSSPTHSQSRAPHHKLPHLPCQHPQPLRQLRQLRVALLIAFLALLLVLLALGQHRRQRGRRQLHRVHAHPRRLLQIRHQRRVGAAQPLRVEALFLRGEREALEVSGVKYTRAQVAAGAGDSVAGNTMLKSLPASLGQLGSLKQLTLAGLGGLGVLPDAVVRVGQVTTLGSLTIRDCGKLRALPRALGKLRELKQLVLGWLDELQEMPDLIGLTARLTATA